MQITSHKKMIGAFQTCFFEFIFQNTMSLSKSAVPLLPSNKVLHVRSMKIYRPVHCVVEEEDKRLKPKKTYVSDRSLSTSSSSSPETSSATPSTPSYRAALRKRKYNMVHRTPKTPQPSKRPRNTEILEMEDLEQLLGTSCTCKKHCATVFQESAALKGMLLNSRNTFTSIVKRSDKRVFLMRCALARTENK